VARRRIRIWTWDAGERLIDPGGDPRRLAPVVQTILDGGLWRQFRRFPADTLARVLPYVDVPPHTRRLLRMWIDHAPRRAA
jgi:hypothetical protein